MRPKLPFLSAKISCIGSHQLIQVGSFVATRHGLQTLPDNFDPVIVHKKNEPHFTPNNHLGLTALAPLNQEATYSANYIPRLF